MRLLHHAFLSVSPLFVCLLIPAHFPHVSLFFSLFLRLVLCFVCFIVCFLVCCPLRRLAFRSTRPVGTSPCLLVCLFLCLFVCKQTNRSAPRLHTAYGRPNHHHGNCRPWMFVCLFVCLFVCVYFYVPRVACLFVFHELLVCLGLFRCCDK